MDSIDASSYVSWEKVHMPHYQEEVSFAFISLCLLCVPLTHTKKAMVNKHDRQQTTTTTTKSKQKQKEKRTETMCLPRLS